MKKDDLVKAQVLQAAEKLFQKWGINKTTMEDIAREAGKGKSTLYYYFKSKEDVFEAVAMAQITRIAGVAREEIAKKDTAKEKLIAYFYTMFREFRQATALYDIGRGELKAHMSLIDGVMRKFDAIDEDIIESILKFGIEGREFKSIHTRDIKDITHAIMTIERSLTIDLFIDKGDKKLIDLIIRLLSEGL
jgi:AcrR family transcriptional regulator